jgi:hypothetical protein
MDMFVYGCNRVLRYFSLINQSVVLYYTKGILENLNMSQKEFREICVLSGTDYNINANTCKNTDTNSLTIYDTIKLFRKYQEQTQPQKNNEKVSFYDWLTISEKILNKIYITDFDLLLKINNMFIISGELYANLFKNMKIINGPMQKELIKDIMKEEGFMYII